MAIIRGTEAGSRSASGMGVSVRGNAHSGREAGRRTRRSCAICTIKSGMTEDDAETLRRASIVAVEEFKKTTEEVNKFAEQASRNVQDIPANSLRTHSSRGSGRIWLRIFGLHVAADGGTSSRSRTSPGKIFGTGGSGLWRRLAGHGVGPPGGLWQSRRRRARRARARVTWWAWARSPSCSCPTHPWRRSTDASCVRFRCHRRCAIMRRRSMLIGNRRGPEVFAPDEPAGSSPTRSACCAHGADALSRCSSRQSRHRRARVAGRCIASAPACSRAVRPGSTGHVHPAGMVGGGMTVQNNLPFRRSTGSVSRQTQQQVAVLQLQEACLRSTGENNRCLSLRSLVFPQCVLFGFIACRCMSVDVVQRAGGYERRNRRWASRSILHLHGRPTS